jgi:negative regulator of sigma E activity
MAVRLIRTLLILVRWPALFVTAAATAMACAATVTAVAEQMHPDERREHQHPYPVL